jgi:phage tail-like protein
MPEAAQTAPPAATGAQPGTFIDPFRAYNFKLQIQGVTEGHFTECSGLEVEVHQSATARAVRRKSCTSSLALSRTATSRSHGLTSSIELWTWLLSAVRGSVERRNVSILMLDSTGATEVVRWDLTNAWPARWRGAPLDALEREIAIENLTLVFETLQRA